MIQNKGEILDRRLDELLKKEFPYINALILEEILMKMESREILSVFKVSKSKNMVVLNKRQTQIKDSIMKELH